MELSGQLTGPSAATLFAIGHYDNHPSLVAVIKGLCRLFYGRSQRSFATSDQCIDLPHDEFCRVGRRRLSLTLHWGQGPEKLISPTLRYRVELGRTCARADLTSSIRVCELGIPRVWFPDMEPEASNTIIASSRHNAGFSSSACASGQASSTPHDKKMRAVLATTE